MACTLLFKQQRTMSNDIVRDWRTRGLELIKERKKSERLKQVIHEMEKSHSAEIKKREEEVKNLKVKIDDLLYLNRQGLQAQSKKLGSRGQIILAAAKYYGVTFEEMKGQTRKRDVVNARKIATYLMIQNDEKVTRDRLGETFNKDHSTITHYFLFVRERLNHKDIKEALDCVSEMVFEKKK